MSIDRCTDGVLPLWLVSGCWQQPERKVRPPPTVVIMPASLAGCDKRRASMRISFYAVIPFNQRESGES